MGKSIDLTSLITLGKEKLIKEPVLNDNQEVAGS